jgi:hypothetical protein
MTDDLLHADNPPPPVETSHRLGQTLPVTLRLQRNTITPQTAGKPITKVDSASSDPRPHPQR